MRILSIDTATHTLSIALGTEDRLHGETSTFGARDHSVRIFPVMEALLDHVGWSIRQIDAIVVGDGPGSYTGVRIGVAAAKNLAYACNIPVVGVSTLYGMAATFQSFPGLICPMIDARRGRVYSGLYRPREDGTGCTVVREDIVDDLMSVLQMIEVFRSPTEPLLFVGDGADAHVVRIRERFAHQASIQVDSTFPSIRAGALIPEGIRLIRNERYTDADKLVPRYLQLVEAEAKLVEQVQRDEEHDRGRT